MVIISSGDDKNINPNENCLVYVTHPSARSRSGVSIILRTPEPDDFINALKESGFNETQARQLCSDTGRSTAILRRKLGFERNNPDWAKPKNINQLLPALLIGRWLNNLEGDKKLIKSFLGWDIANSKILFRHLLKATTVLLDLLIIYGMLYLHLTL